MLIKSAEYLEKAGKPFRCTLLWINRYLLHTGCIGCDGFLKIIMVMKAHYVYYDGSGSGNIPSDCKGHGLLGGEDHGYKGKAVELESFVDVPGKRVKAYQGVSVQLGHSRWMNELGL